MSEGLLRASELPPGSVMLPRQGRALTGEELKFAVVGTAQELLRNESCPKVDEMVEELQREILKSDWAKAHITYPKAKVRLVVKENSKKLSIEVLLGLGDGEERVYRVAEEILAGDWTTLVSREAGPTRVPDEMRERLGLPLTAHFKLPNGERVLASLEPAETQVVKSPKVVKEEEKKTEVDVPAVKVELTGSELVGEAVVGRAPQQAPQVVAKPGVKGARK